MSEPLSDIDAGLKAKILAILNENRVMTVATLRPDGWPQATMVGYVNDDLALYFAVARNSQKYANIARDPRISITLGRDCGDHIRGLSMAAHGDDVSDIDDVMRLNQLLAERYPEEAVFAPREASSVLMRATPRIISVIDLDKGPGHPDLVQVASETVVRRLTGEPS